jgi:hypothetical protein
LLDRRAHRPYTVPVKSLAAFLLLTALCLIGCHHPSGGTGVSALPPPSAAPAAEGDDVLRRLPAPVAVAFRKEHPHNAATRIHVRLFPDGSAHYQVIYADNSGQPHQAEYYGDGKDVR